MIIAARTSTEKEHQKVVKQFVIDTNKRLQSESLMKNPFNGDMFRMGPYLIFAAAPVFPNFLPRRFMCWIMKRGLMKTGYTGPWRYLSKDETMEVLLSGITDTDT